MAVESRALMTRSGGSTLPWSFYLFRVSPWQPVMTGVVFGAALLALGVFAEFLSGRPQALLSGRPAVDVGCEYLLGDYRIGIVFVILLAYAMTARYILSGWTLGAATSLSALPLADAEELAQTHRLGFLPGLAGSLICLAMAVDIAESPIEWRRSYWILPHVFNWTWCIPFGWVGGRLIFALISNAIRISRRARKLQVERLDDTNALDAVIRHGTRTALLSVMFLGLVSVHFIDPGFGAPAVTFLVILFLTGVVVSGLPVIGVVQAMDDARDRQIETLTVELESEQRRLLDGGPGYEPGRISDLIALERRLRDWRVPVVRFSVLIRLAFYAIVGFLSWLGAAAVSVVVESFFGF